MFRNQFAQFYINCTRSFSSAPLELSEAWKQLGEKTIKFQPTALQQRTIENERRWALAEDVCFKLNLGKNKPHNIFISWLGRPEWNLNVALSSCKNRYESEIMALYYTMIYAHHKQIFYVSLYTYNEIVAKVASGQYNAHKFKNLYDKILRRMTDDNDILRARITYLDPNLIKSKSIIEPEKQMDIYQFLSEDDFLDKMGGSTKFRYMNKSDLLANRVFCYFFRNCSSVASSSSGKTVHTTGYSYKHRDGRFVGKYGIYFDAGDKRNKLEEIYGKEMTHVAAKIYAIIEAIKLSEKNTDLTVKTDYKIESLELLKKYAKHDFRRYYFPYDRVTNADLLQELHELIEERQQRIDLVYSAPELGEKNPVTELILKDMYKTFKPYYPNVDLPQNKAEKHGLKKVLVVTDSPYFLKHWKTGWKTIKGEDISNKYLYNRIYDLVYNRRMTVRFRYEKPNESSIWTTLRQRCEKALMMPLSPANTSYYDKTPDEITTIRCPLIDAGEEVCRVRYFKKGTRYKNGLLWDKINSTEEAKFMTTSSGKIVDVILAILRHAVEENNDVIVIRTDSIQFLKKIESWMPVWKRSGWRNSRQGQIFDWEKWQEADRLLAQVKIYWELMDPPSSEDIADVEKFAPKKRRGRNKTTEENIEAKEEVQEMEDILNDEDDSGNVAIAARI